MENTPCIVCKTVQQCIVSFCFLHLQADPLVATVATSMQCSGQAASSGQSGARAGAGSAAACSESAVVISDSPLIPADWTDSQVPDSPVHVCVDGAADWTDSQVPDDPPAGGPVEGNPASDMPTEPLKKKCKSIPAERSELIPNPPSLPEHVEKLVGPVPSESVGTNVRSQRELKKQLDEEAKEKAEEKKQNIEKKKKEAVAKALEKAQKKLEKAQAKAAALDKKEQAASTTRKRLRRQLDCEFKGAADSSVQVSPEKKPEVELKGPKTPKVKLSPKAKKFATQKRADKSQEGLEILRAAELPDLPIPSPCTRQTLVCMDCCKLCFVL